MTTTSTTPADRRPKNRTMLLPVKLDQDAVAVRAKEMGAVCKARTDKAIELEHYIKASKGAKETLLGELAGLDSHLSLLGSVVRTEREDREVEVLDEIDAKKGVMNTIRLDTNEVVGTRGLTEAERQRSLFDAQRERNLSSQPATVAGKGTAKGEKGGA